MRDRDAFLLACAVVASLTLARVAVLFLTPLELYPDEAQYWWWAQTPDFGYFSKPPVIAWIIWLTTSVCGDGEACIRIASPLLHGGIALVLFAVARALYDARIGLWTALAYATLPGTVYSSALISTDVPLLFCWAVALLAFVRAMETRAWTWALLCGAAAGAGLMAKYAMLYFFAGAVLAALVHAPARRFVLSWRGFAVIVLALAILLPNILWNLDHRFATVAHTAANANWRESHFGIVGMLEFLASQFGVVGPLMMAGFLLALWRLARGPARASADLLLAAFALPPLAVVTVQAFISEANANWAATAYVAATPLAVATLVRLWRGWPLWGSLALHGAVAAIGLVVFAMPGLAVDAGLGGGFKRMKGWRDLGRAVLAEASRGNYQAIAADNRSALAALHYYARERALPLLAWDDDASPDDHFEMTAPLTPAVSGHVLLVTVKEDDARVLRSFAATRLVATHTADLGGGARRVARLYDAAGYSEGASR